VFLSSFPHDIKTKSGLTKLFNKKVVSVQSVERPLGGIGIPKKVVSFANKYTNIKTSISGQKDRATHSGVIVTTKDGGKYLVHKGKKFGKLGQTVVVNVKHMGKSWKNIGKGKDVNGNSVGDFVKAGGKDYNFLGNNCHNAHDRMKKVGKRSPC
jgi:hypothetical protein